MRGCDLIIGREEQHALSSVKRAEFDMLKALITFEIQSKLLHIQKL